MQIKGMLSLSHFLVLPCSRTHTISQYILHQHHPAGANDTRTTATPRYSVFPRVAVGNVLATAKDLSAELQGYARIAHAGRQ